MVKELKPTDVKTLVDLAGSMTGAGDGGNQGHARRAFELAHRARRLCELGAEHASRNRWSVLQAPTAQPEDTIQRFAQACAAVVIVYPVHGEAAVYASLLTAADCAREVAEELYKAWLETQPKAERSENPAYVERLGQPMAEGCRWNRPPESEDD